MSKTKVLNLYAGIGGNRKLWRDVDVTAIEHDKAIATLYKKYYPRDTVIVADAHQYLLDHYKEYDFIWSSPPFHTHSDIRRCGVNSGIFDAVYPDMNLWQEIIFLTHFSKCKWVVENVRPYYEPIIKPSFKLHRHLFWSNFAVVDNVFFSDREISNIDKFTGNTINFGFDLRDEKIPNKRRILRNLVHPEVGLHILNSAIGVADTSQFEEKQFQTAFLTQE